MNQNIINILLITQIIISALLTVGILLQNRAEGLGKMFGGGGEVFRTKRGLEKFLYYFTMILAAALVIISLIVLKFS
jgi:preprotein translocase subunit SecG